MISPVESILPALKPAEPRPLEARQALIVACGFEDRTLAFTELVPSSAGRAAAIVLDYRPVHAENRTTDLRAALRRIGVGRRRTHFLEFSRYDPQDYPRLLSCAIRELEVSSVILDISTMSKFALLLTLSVLQEMEMPVVVHYAEAREYGPTREEFEAAKNAGQLHRPSIQVYSGVQRLVHHKRLSSVAMQGQPIAIIAFMSLSDLLIQALLDSFFPSRLLLINGQPPEHQWRAEATAWIHEQIRSEWPRDNPANSSGPLPERAACTLDYRETVALLSDLYWQLAPSHRVVLAPTGSKMQALGCFLIRASHRDVHIEYPTPKTFWSTYSRGIGSRWTVDFGNLEGLAAEMKEVEIDHYLRV